MADASDMVEMVLGCCGVVVWYPKNFVEDKRNTKATFYCPNGHARSYAESTEERLQKRLDAANSELAATKGRIEKLKEGKCPFCWRTVKDLSSHLKRRH